MPIAIYKGKQVYTDFGIKKMIKFAQGMNLKYI